MQEQHKKATGEEMKVTASEELKLKQGAVLNNLASTLIETDSTFFPYTFCILNILAVRAVTKALRNFRAMIGCAANAYG